MADVICDDGSARGDLTAASDGLIIPVAISSTRGTLSGQAQSTDPSSACEVTVMFNRSLHQRLSGVHTDDLGAGAVRGPRLS